MIYKNWTKDTIKDYTKTLYRDVFTADTTLYDVTVRMDRVNVVIMPPHIHKICGISTTNDVSMKE